MLITEYKVRLWNDQRLRALVTIVFDDSFVVRNIKVIEGRDHKLFVAMPSRKLPDGTFVDIAHPITHEFRDYMSERILGAYENEKADFERDPEAYRRSKRAGTGSHLEVTEGASRLEEDDQDRRDEDSRGNWV